MPVTFHYRYTVQDHGGRSRVPVARAFRGSFEHVLADLGPAASVVGTTHATAGGRRDGAAAVTVLRKHRDQFYEEVPDGTALLASPDAGDELVARFGGRRLFDARSTPWLPGTTNADRIAGADHRREDALRDARMDAGRFALVDGVLHLAVAEPVIAVGPDGPRVVANAGAETTAFRLDEVVAAVECARRRGAPCALDGVEVHDTAALALDPVTRGMRSTGHGLATAMATTLGWAPRDTVVAYARLRDALGPYKAPGDADAIREAIRSALACPDAAALDAAGAAEDAAGTYDLRASFAPSRSPGMAP